MRKMKIIVCIILSFVAFLLPLAIVISLAALTPVQYGETFYRALPDKFDRLMSTEGKKIVVVGGSSVAFGLDSELLEEYTGMPCVNFGLYAALGTKLMLDLSRPGINDGDIVILAPELDAQTLSMYFSAESTLMATDGRYDLLKYVRGDDRLSLLGGLYGHAADKIAHMREGTAPSPVGVYRSDSFNEYGDIACERAENVMPLYYDPNTRVTLDSDILDEDFIDYVNEYVRYCERRGASVYFSFCPVNEMALADGTDESTFAKFESYLRRVLDCELISYLDDYVMEAGYFYDTNFHLNDAGVVVRTLNLAQDIRIILGDMTLIEAERPTAPELPMADVRFDGEDENVKYFRFERQDNGSMVIVGLSEVGMSMKTLTVPLGYDGYKVSAIDRAAFSGSSVETLIITADTNLRNFFDGAFADSMIRDVYVYYVYEDESDMLSPCSDFFGINLHVPAGSSYLWTYSWDKQNVKNVNKIPDL